MINITQSKLMALLNKVQAAIDSRANMSVAFGCIYISSSKGKLSVCATNQSIEINTFASRGEGVEFEDGISFVLPGKKLINIVKQASSDTEVTIKAGDTNGCILTFSGMRSKFKLLSIPADDFPKVNLDKNDAAYFSFNPEVLARAIDTVEPAVASGDVRYYLNGLNLSIKNELATLTGTDGHRLLTNKMVVEHMKGADSCNVIIPKESIKPIYSLIKSTNEECALSFSANHVQMKVGYTVFTSKLIDGVYPDPSRAIPKQNDNSVTFDTKCLVSLLNRVSILANEKFRSVRLEINGSEAKFMAKNTSDEQSFEVAEVETGKDNFSIEIGLNIDYLLSAVKLCVCEKVTLKFRTSNEAVVVQNDLEKDFLGVIMPMRL